MNHKLTPQNIFTLVEAFFKPSTERKYNHYSNSNAITANWSYYMAATIQTTEEKTAFILHHQYPHTIPSQSSHDQQNWIFPTKNSK
jgi:hypothetical protein